MTSLGHVLYVITSLLLLASFSQDGITGRNELSRAADLARKGGLDSSFVEHILRSESADFVEKSVRINVTNYAYKPDYSGHYNKQSVQQVRSFMSENDSLLKAIESKRGVRKEIIASILWIESRCGKITGTYHVPSVYLSLLLAPDSMYVEQSLERVTKDGKLDSAQVDSVRDLIVRRAERKAAWALKELKALQTIQQRKVMDVAQLKGSWAGAFGFPQFLPSSYNSWAVDGDADGTIDLYHLPDAGHSIANYLKDNGWSKTKDSQRKAVHHYNNSDAYVDAVFTLAAKVK